MAATTMLHVRMDGELKAKGMQALDAMGLSAADAVRLLFHRIVADQAFPLELKVPNTETRAAMAEADDMMRAGRPRFAPRTEADESQRVVVGRNPPKRNILGSMRGQIWMASDEEMAQADREIEALFDECANRPLEPARADR